ncbi:hypothetical protein TNCV_573751 [Trichonephila clavipes]|nr:hypothetical protein TNCV_573751 [Trichonephila clavipes]
MVTPGFALFYLKIRHRLSWLVLLCSLAGTEWTSLAESGAASPPLDLALNHSVGTCPAFTVLLPLFLTWSFDEVDTSNLLLWAPLVGGLIFFCLVPQTVRKEHLFCSSAPPVFFAFCIAAAEALLKIHSNH